MSKNTYDVIDDFDVTGTDELSVEPYWLLCVFRLKYPTTYSRSAGGSFSTLYTDAVELRGKPLVISEDCYQLTVSGSKASYTMQLSASLLNGDTNYLSEVFPGDYVMAWMVNNKETYLDLIDRIQNLDQGGDSLNKFSDGLKFYGRVQSLRKKLTQAPNGARYLRYSLNAISFSEFDAQIFYDPHLAEKTPQIGNYFGRLGTSLNRLVDSKNTIDVNKAIPFFLDLLVGRGIPDNIGRGNTDPRLRATTGLTADYSYIAPKLIGQAFGKQGEGPVLTYSDLLETIIGIQKYSGGSFQEEPVDDSIARKDQIQISRNFQPDDTTSGGSRRFTNDDMLGDFLPQTPHFTNKTVWSVLQQYLNPAVNEMYTCLRINPDGLVVPTLVVRQLPFTSQFLQTDLSVTRFLELPRWGIHEVLVQDVDIGRSDSLRINFVHVYGDSIDHVAPFSNQIVRNPPVRDDLDIARSGLRSHMQTIPCAPEDTRNGSPKKWMEISSDILIGQQMTLTGVMTTIGIQAPICYGDNLEWDGVVYHIESVTHNCSIGGDGRKSFRTTLALTHGLRSEVNSPTNVGIYASIDPADQTLFNPGRTVTATNQDDQSSVSGEIETYLKVTE